MTPFSFSHHAAILSVVVILSLGSGAAQEQKGDAHDTNTAGLNVMVLDYKVVSDARIDDLRFSEASGASYDHDEQLLHIVSDRGRIFSFNLSIVSNRFVSIEPVSAFKLRDVDGKQMHRVGFNPEGLEIRNAKNGKPGDASLIVVSEVGPTIAEFTTAGDLISVVRVPEDLRNPALQRGLRDGLESFALHPEYGFLTAPEEPLRGHPRRTHSLYGSGGKLFSFDVSEAGSTNIKALEVLEDGRILILETLKSRDKVTLTPILRVLDPEECDEAEPCPTKWSALSIPEFPDATFEGIADIGGGLFVIVSDDKISGEHRTVFGLVRLLNDE